MVVFLLNEGSPAKIEIAIYSNRFLKTLLTRDAFVTQRTLDVHNRKSRTARRSLSVLPGKTLRLVLKKTVFLRGRVR